MVSGPEILTKFPNHLYMVKCIYCPEIRSCAEIRICPENWHEKVIRGCFHRNEIPGFSVAVALSGSAETRSLF